MVKHATLSTRENSTLLEEISLTRNGLSQALARLLDHPPVIEVQLAPESALATERIDRARGKRSAPPLNSSALAAVFLLGVSARLLAGPVLRGLALACMASAVRPALARMAQEPGYVGEVARTATRPIAISLIRLTTRLLVSAILNRNRAARVQMADS